METKTCARCHAIKPRSDFAGRWGTSPYCRACYPAWRKEDDRQRHADPAYLARANARRRERYRTDPTFAEDRKQAIHAYRLAHPIETAAKNRDWARRNPERAAAAVARYQQRERAKVFASVTLRDAVKKGIVAKLACAVCGAAESEAHHHNGYAPEHILDVVWLCRRHHKEQHRKYAR